MNVKVQMKKGTYTWLLQAKCLPIVLKFEAKLTKFLSIPKQSLATSNEQGNAVKKTTTPAASPPASPPPIPPPMPLSWDGVFK